MLTSILAGLGVALGWGVADLAGKKVVDRMGTFGPILAIQLTCSLLVCLGLLVLKVPLVIDRHNLLLILAGGSLLNLSWFLFYRALELGLVSIISAMYTLYALVPFIWQVGFEKLDLKMVNFLGAGLMIVAGVLVAINLRELAKTKKANWAKGTKEIMAAVLLVGVGLILLDRAVENCGWKTMYFYNQLLSVIEVVFFLLILGKIKYSRIPSQWSWFTLVVAFNIIAFVSLNAGMDFGEVGVISVISCFSAAITALLARIFLREKLVTNQYIGIAVGIAGLIGLSL